jgi:hypothetical protein
VILVILFAKFCTKSGGGAPPSPQKCAKYHEGLVGFFCTFLRRGLPTMGCHPMLTENANFVTNSSYFLGTVYKF